jgi:hypothetical protein
MLRQKKRPMGAGNTSGAPSVFEGTKEVVPDVTDIVQKAKDVVKNAERVSEIERLRRARNRAARSCGC